MTDTVGGHIEDLRIRLDQTDYDDNNMSQPMLSEEEEEPDEIEHAHYKSR